MPRWDVSFDLRVAVEDPGIVRTLANIEAMSAVIRDIPLPPPVQRRIDRLNILRAVRGTTGIEGTELTEDEVGRIMDASPGERVLPASRQRDEMEARNAERVMRYVADELRRDPGLPLTEELICTLHDLTTSGIDYENNEPGVYRSHLVRAGTYVPPTSREEIVHLMREFVRWFNEGPPQHWSAAVRAVVAHFYVVSIHPFGDGNGRTARAVESFLLYQGGINARGFYSLANYYYRLRDRYVALLDSVRFSGGRDLTPFVRFALDGLLSELQDVHKEILAEVKVIAFRDFAREALTLTGKLNTKGGQRMLNLLVGLTFGPVSLAALRRGMHPLSHLYGDLTPKTLSRDLKLLRSEELVVVEGDDLKANLDVMSQFVP